jgi:hypothetical protein
MATIALMEEIDIDASIGFNGIISEHRYYKHNIIGYKKITHDKQSLGQMFLQGMKAQPLPQHHLKVHPGEIML